MADYCTDTFRMVEDNEDSFRMWQGLVGPYYTPWVSNDGTLTWSNNGGLPNPGEVNIMGPQGAGIRIAGLADTEEGLPDRSDIGGIWLVGTELPYEGWSFVRNEWIDLGPLTVGPAGPPGPQGDDYVLTEADKTEIAGIAVDQFEQQLEIDPLPILNGGTGARDVAGAQTALGIDEILTKLGTWPLGTDAQDVAGAVNEMIGQISLQGQDIDDLQDTLAVQDLYFSLGSKTGTGSNVTWTLTDSRITAKHRAFTGDVVFGTPAAVTGNGTLTTAPGSVTLTAPVNGTTTAAVHLWYDPDYS